MVAINHGGIEGHADTLLCSKRKGAYGRYFSNNIGVAQGSPISAQLFAICADTVMGGYASKLKKQTSYKKLLLKATFSLNKNGLPTKYSNAISITMDKHIKIRTELINQKTP